MPCLRHSRQYVCKISAFVFTIATRLAPINLTKIAHEHGYTRGTCISFINHFFVIRFRISKSWFDCDNRVVREAKGRVGNGLWLTKSRVFRPRVGTRTSCFKLRLRHKSRTFSWLKSPVIIIPDSGKLPSIHVSVDIYSKSSLSSADGGR